MIKDGENGLLVGFFDTDGIAEQVLKALNQSERFQRLKHAEYGNAQRYSSKDGVDGYIGAIGVVRRLPKDTVLCGVWVLMV